MNDQLKQSFHSISLLYGCISFFITIIHNVFLLYHIDMFVTVYKIDKLSFWLGEVSSILSIISMYQLLLQYHTIDKQLHM